MTYNWFAMLITLTTIISTTKISYFLVSKIKNIKESREYNIKQDKIKLSTIKYRTVIKQNNKIGIFTNGTFFLLCVPFISTLNKQSLLSSIFTIICILMIYDFFYYLMHRYLFHGKGYFLRIHSLHHQARRPTRIDAQYVSPIETFMGLSLFLFITTLYGFLVFPMHVITLSILFIIYTQINILNHTYTNIPGFIYTYLNYMTQKHHIHHENMKKGNYASITLLFDKIFGTLE